MKKCSKCKTIKEIDKFYTGRCYCKECGRKMVKAYKEKNKDKIRSYNKEYKQKNKDIIKKYNHEYNIRNRDSIRIRQKKYQMIKRSEDLNYKISLNLRNKLNKIIKMKKTSSKELLGCDIETLIKWLKYQFEEDMNMEKSWINMAYRSCYSL